MLCPLFPRTPIFEYLRGAMMTRIETKKMKIKRDATRWNGGGRGGNISLSLCVCVLLQLSLVRFVYR